MQNRHDLKTCSVEFFTACCDHFHIAGPTAPGHQDHFSSWGCGWGRVCIRSNLSKKHLVLLALEGMLRGLGLGEWRREFKNTYPLISWPNWPKEVCKPDLGLIYFFFFPSRKGAIKLCAFLKAYPSKAVIASLLDEMGSSCFYPSPVKQAEGDRAGWPMSLLSQRTVWWFMISKPENFRCWCT